MAFNDKCPRCQRYNMRAVDHKFMEGGLIAWRECPFCKHKWREIYELDLIHSDLPYHATDEKESDNG